MTQNPFELSQQMRDLAENNVEQARVAFGQFMDAMTQAMGMWSSGLASNEMTSGFKIVQDRAIRFAKQNAEAGFALAGDLTNAKDIQEVLSLQNRYVQLNAVLCPSGARAGTGGTSRCDRVAGPEAPPPQSLGGLFP